MTVDMDTVAASTVIQVRLCMYNHLWSLFGI